MYSIPKQHVAAYLTQQKYTFLILLLSFAYPIQCSSLESKNAVVVCDAVIDAVGAPLGNSTSYNNFPFLWTQKEQAATMRVHQLLFNEVGIVKKETDTEVLVEFPHFICQRKDNSTNSAFWVLKSSVTPIASIKQLYNSIHMIPLPISESNKHIATLKAPWLHQETNTMYSAGTRFVRTYKDNTTHIGIYICNYRQQIAYKASLPVDLVVTQYPAAEREAKRLFVALLQEWCATQNSSNIPYVWGGCSFTKKQLATQFVATTTGWKRPDTEYVHTGFDCSGAVLRAAQIAGLSYFCKNTATIGLQLTPLGLQETLESGDLILTEGHVMVVSNYEKNLLIEAAGYLSGYGILHEIPLDQIFLEAHTYKQLETIYATNGELTRINIRKQPFKKYSPITLLRMTSQVMSPQPAT